MHTTLLQTPSVAVSLILVLIIQRREVIGDNSPCNRTKAKVELGQNRPTIELWIACCLVRYWLVAHMYVAGRRRGWLFTHKMAGKGKALALFFKVRAFSSSPSSCEYRSLSLHLGWTM
jgi:hypothetical protein